MLKYHLYAGLFWSAGLLLVGSSAYARHIIGGEITYEYLRTDAAGRNVYRFTMKVYRDCLGGGAGYDNPAEMAIYRGSFNNNVLHEAFRIFSPSIRRLTPEPPPCVTQLPVVCVEEGIYTFERALPVINESYFIVYQRCCRNQTIRNIVAPGDIGATYYVELTAAAQQVRNNSPTFKNFPPIIICANVPLVFDHSATDAEGDFITYSLCAPLQGGGPILNPPGLYSCSGAVPTPPCAPPFDQVPFILPNYTAINPLDGSPPLSIHPQTGLMTGIPTTIGQFVVGVCIQEYRGATLLSEVRRDFQFNVAECAPTVLANIRSDSVAGVKRFVLNSCGNNTVTFQNLSIQRNQITEWEWRFNLKTSTFTDKQNWDATVTFPDTGTYTGTLILNPGKPCSDTGYIAVNIYPKIKADFTFDYDTCVAGPVNFTDLSKGEGGINRWSWNFGVPNGSSTERNPDFLFPAPGNHPVTLRVTDRNRCSDAITKTVRWFPVPPLIVVSPDRFIGCIPADIVFNNLSSPIDSTYKIVWDFGDGQTARNIISPTHRYLKPGVFTVSVAITSPIGCFTSDTFVNLIRTEPRPSADFTFSPEVLNSFERTVSFFDRSIDANRWNWRFDRFGTSIQQNPTFTFPDTGLMAVTLIVTHPRGCKDSLTRYIDVVPEVRWFMPNAFTPNNDGQNDGFLGNGYLEGVVDFSLTIWNRWGEMVFQTNDPNEAWNGRKMNVGPMSPEGVYVYVVTFTEPRGQRREFKGFATLLR
jgi:gliding motility-associated-like protein